MKYFILYVLCTGIFMSVLSLIDNVRNNKSIPIMCSSFILSFLSGWILFPLLSIMGYMEGWKELTNDNKNRNESEFSIRKKT